MDNGKKRISLKQYNIELEASIKEMKQGKGISHAEVVKRSAKWLKRK